MSKRDYDMMLAEEALDFELECSSADTDYYCELSELVNSTKDLISKLKKHDNNTIDEETKSAISYLEKLKEHFEKEIKKIEEAL